MPAPGRGGPLEAVLGGASEWTPALESLEAWAPAGRPCSKALATSRNGWKEDGCDCRRGGKGKMLVPSAPLLLSRRRDSLPALGLGLACARGWVVMGAQCRGEYSPPRALIGCTLLPPIRGLGL